MQLAPGLWRESLAVFPVFPSILDIKDPVKFALLVCCYIPSHVGSISGHSFSRSWIDISMALYVALYYMIKFLALFALSKKIQL
jgi:hypothetical protein